MADEPDDIDTLKQKLADADAERAQLLERTQVAEREASEAREAAKNAGGRVQQNELDIVKGGIENLKTTRDILKAKKREARAAGNDDEVDALDDQLTEAAVKLHRLEEGKAILEVQAANPQPAHGTALKPFMSLTRTEKAERIASGLTPKSADWVRARPDLVQTPEQVNALVGAHHIAINKGITSDTDAYFADVANTLGLTAAAVRTEATATDDAVSTAGAATQKRDAPPPAAPASRGGGNGSLARTLSPDEIEIAASSGLTPEEYAANKEALAKEGRLGTKH